MRKIEEAVALAEAELTGRFGAAVTAGQRPYRAVILDRYWIVTGSAVEGKVAEVRLRVEGGGIVSARMLPVRESVADKLPAHQLAPFHPIRPGEYE